MIGISIVQTNQAPGEYTSLILSRAVDVVNLSCLVHLSDSLSADTLQEKYLEFILQNCSDLVSYNCLKTLTQQL